MIEKELYKEFFQTEFAYLFPILLGTFLICLAIDLFRWMRNFFAERKFFSLVSYYAEIVGEEEATTFANEIMSEGVPFSLANKLLEAEFELFALTNNYAEIVGEDAAIAYVNEAANNKTDIYVVIQNLRDKIQNTAKKQAKEI